MELNELLQQIEKDSKQTEKKVFSMYLNTDPKDPDQQGGEWRIHLKNGMKNFESYLKESDDEEELKDFEQVQKNVDKFMKENDTKLLRSVIIFASGDEVVWFADTLQMHVENEFHWEAEPRLEQLHKLQEKYPRTGVILVQQNEVKVLDANLNRVQDTINYELDIETEDWKIKQGPRQQSHGTSGKGATNAQIDNFVARYEANQQRWYKSIAPKLDKKAKEYEWEKIYIIGAGNPSNELSKQMNKPINDIINKNMLEHEDSKVLEEVYS